VIYNCALVGCNKNDRYLYELFIYLLTFLVYLFGRIMTGAHRTLYVFALINYLTFCRRMSVYVRSSSLCRVVRAAGDISMHAFVF
jgi:hypothetical protein